MWFWSHISCWYREKLWYFLFDSCRIKYSISPVHLNQSFWEQDIEIQNGFSQLWKYRNGLAHKQFVSLYDWECLVVASDRPRRKLDKCCKQLGAQGLTDNQGRSALCASNNEIWFNPESCKPADLENPNSKLKHLIWKKLGKGQGRKLWLGTVTSEQRKISGSFQVCFCVEFSVKAP